MFKKSLLYFLLFSFVYGNDVGIPDDSCALIIASRETKSDVKAYIDENITYTKYVTLYESNNGWYAIALGFLKNYESKSIMRQWKNEGRIPSDSFCTHGNKFKKEVFIDDDVYSVATTTTSNNRSSYSKEESSSSSKSSNKQLKCLALTWGPDVCSQSFSRYADEKDMDDINDIIKSPACATMIAKSLGEDVTQEDITLAMVTGAADEAASAGLNSENIFFKFLGGVAGMYSFGLKAVIYDSCMNK